MIITSDVVHVAVVKSGEEEERNVVLRHGDGRGHYAAFELGPFQSPGVEGGQHFGTTVIMWASSQKERKGVVLVKFSELLPSY